MYITSTLKLLSYLMSTVGSCCLMACHTLEMETKTFIVEAMVHSYHMYQDIWDAVIGEHFPCQREFLNPRDPFAVAVVKSQVTVGHIPRKIRQSVPCFSNMVGQSIVK